MIRFNNVSHHFGCTNKPALKNISLTIDEGEFVFITGHSGCGKTTLLRLLLRELLPTVGTVEFLGDNLSLLSPRKVAKHRQKVGVVFQDYQLLDDLTVWENIALPMQIAKLPKSEISKRINELVKLLKLESLENKFPAQLSGGEAQRVGLSRALAIAPKVIFADEPTGNLDAENSQTIISLLGNINHYGTTVIVATHNLEIIPLVANARHLVLEQGELIADQAPSKKTPPKNKNIKSESDTENKKTTANSKVVDNKKKSTPKSARDNQESHHE